MFGVHPLILRGAPRAPRIAAPHPSAGTAWRSAAVAARWRAPAPLPRHRTHVSSRAPCSSPRIPRCLDREETVTQSQPCADRSPPSPRSPLSRCDTGSRGRPDTRPAHDPRAATEPEPRHGRTHPHRAPTRRRGQGGRAVDCVRSRLRRTRVVDRRTRSAGRSSGRRLRGGRPRDVRPPGDRHATRHDVAPR